MYHQFTSNFNVEEFFASSVANSRKISNIPTSVANCISLVSNLPKTAYLLERVRQSLGVPIRVSSGYRTPQLNKAVKGVSNSYHMLGAAADIQCAKMNDLYRVLLDVKARYSFNGEPLFKIVPESGWYHIQLTQVGLDAPLYLFIKLVHGEEL